MELKKKSENGMFDCCVTYEDSYIQDVTDILTTALEGGSNYWYNLDTMGFKFTKGIPYSEQIINAVLYDGVAFAVTDIEDDEESELLGYLSLENIDRGYELFTSEYNGIDLSDVDADLADVFFQYVVMGEVVYG